MRELRWGRAWLGTWLLLLVGLVGLCLVPAPPDPVAVRHADKLYHLLGYALLAGWAVQLWAPPALWWRLGGLLALGVALEGAQALLPWRSADALDAVANAGGVLLGGLLACTPLARTFQGIERRLQER